MRLVFNIFIFMCDFLYHFNICLVLYSNLIYRSLKSNNVILVTPLNENHPWVMREACLNKVLPYLLCFFGGTFLFLC